MQRSGEVWLIRQGLDDEDYLLLWPVSEWAIAILVLGVLLILQHVLWGFIAMNITLLLLIKGRSLQRGSKAHALWRLQLLRGKRGLDWSPSAHATRFDN